MAAKYQWTKKIFCNTYEIFQDGQRVGMLKENPWNLSALGAIGGNSYSFTLKGFFRQESEIIDTKSQKVMGKITYGSWFNKAIIHLNGEKFTWKSSNYFTTKWGIRSGDASLIAAKGSSHKGWIEADENHEILALAGLFVNNYYSQMVVIFLIIMIVIFVI